jgi:phosphoribosylformimino-5-aminoimidazole carboxamide ribotide isomerase
MRIVGVLDLKGGAVVRGVAGRREQYRPIVSRLCRSAEPGEVARAMVGAYGLRELYLADLDAIAGSSPAWAVYDVVRRSGASLWIDAGLRTADDGLRLAEAGTVVAGLETVAGLDVVERLARRLGDRLVFSLDLRMGRPLAWGPDPEAVARSVVERGVRRLLVLDLTRVGVGRGTGTEELCARLAAAYPDVEVSAGGGVRGKADLERLAACGVRAALVASALHDGALDVPGTNEPRTDEPRTK